MTAEQLKNSILKLAIQGKLVPQEKGDEPASVLIEKIRKEKEKLIKLGKIKKEKTETIIYRKGNSFYERTVGTNENNVGANENIVGAKLCEPKSNVEANPNIVGAKLCEPEGSVGAKLCEPKNKTTKNKKTPSPIDKCIDDELPFEIPKSWEWVRLKDVCNIINGFTPLRTESNFWKNGDIPWFTVEDIRNQGHRIKSTVQKITKKALSKDSNRILPKETVLLCCTASVGEYAITEIEMTTNQQFNGLIVKDEYKKYYSTEFLFLLVQTFKDRLVSAAGKTTFNFISVKKLGEFLIPMLSINEQNRIINKYYEFPKYIDKYNTFETELNILDTEFPDKLKKSILKIAIQGKLVPQEKGDEPAAVLIEKIRKEKEKLIKSGKIKKEKIETIIYRKGNSFYERTVRANENIVGAKLWEPKNKTIKNKKTPSLCDKCIDDELPFEIPKSWEWGRLGDLLYIISGTSYKNTDVKKKGIRIIRGGNIQNNKIIFYDNDVFLEEKYKDIDKTIKTGDVVFVASTGSKEVIGKPAFVNTDVCINNIQIGAFLRIARQYSKNVIDWIKIIFSSNYYKKHIKNCVKGTNINNIKNEYITNLLIPIPPLQEQKRIVNKIEQLFDIINKK